MNYCVQVWDEIRSRHATFSEALEEATRLSAAGSHTVQIFNSDRTDGDYRDGAMVYHDGLTQDEREQMSEAL